MPTLRRRTGRDRGVVNFMERDKSTREFMDRFEDYVRYVVPHYIAEGKSYLTIAIGCTGGRHRSVMIAERLRRAMAGFPASRCAFAIVTSAAAHDWQRPAKLIPGQGRGLKAKGPEPFALQHLSQRAARIKP